MAASAGGHGLPKESHFFNSDDEFQLVAELDTYLGLFAEAGDAHVAVGEASTWYLMSGVAVENIEAFSSHEAKYIVFLRNPVNMTRSLHAQLVESRSEGVRSFEKAWALQAARAQGYKVPFMCPEPKHLQYEKACALGTMVERLLETVLSERVLFMLLDDLSRDPEGTFRTVQAFLDLQDMTGSITFEARNAANLPASASLGRSLAIIGAVKRKLGVRWKFGLLNRPRKWNRRSGERADMPADFEAVLRDRFAPEADKLERMLGRDLSHWR